MRIITDFLEKCSKALISDSKIPAVNQIFRLSVASQKFPRFCLWLIKLPRCDLANKGPQLHLKSRGVGFDNLIKMQYMCIFNCTGVA